MTAILARLAADLADGALGIGVLLGYAPAASPAEYLSVAALAAEAGVPTFTDARDLIETVPDAEIDGAEEIVRAAAETGAHIEPARLLAGPVPAMRRKGRLQAGMDADVVVFDPQTITDRAPAAAPAFERSYAVRTKSSHVDRSCVLIAPWVGAAREGRGPAGRVPASHVLSSGRATAARRADGGPGQAARRPQARSARRQASRWR